MTIDAARQPRMAIAQSVVVMVATFVAAMVIAKLVAIISVAAMPLGGARLQEALPEGVFIWFAEDVVVGGAVGGWLGVWQALWFGRRWRAIGVGVGYLFAVVVAVATGLATIAYIQFGYVATAAWLALAVQGGDIGDSLFAVASQPLALLVPGLVVVAVVGPHALHGAFASSMPIRWVGAVLAALIVVAGLVSVYAKPRPLRLDRNWLASMVSQMLIREVTWAATTRTKNFEPVLRPIVDSIQVAPRDRYDEVREWARQTRPNVILVILETMAVRHLQVFGGPIANTPTLAALAEQSVLWPRLYAHIPLSMPAIYSILCGAYSAPWRSPITQRNPRVDCQTISEQLVADGYRAGLWHSGRFSYYAKDQFLRGRGYSVLHDASTMPNREQYDEGSWGLEEAAAVDALLEWITRPSEQPFFATYVPVFPHHPYQVPHGFASSFAGSSTAARYRQSVSYMDHILDRLMTGVKTRGVLDNTIVVFVGDHGEGFGEHPGSHMHGTTLYEEAVRTFAMWHVPFVLRASVRDTRALGQVDMVPTLLDLLGKPKSSEHPGLSARANGPRPMIPLFLAKPHRRIGLVDGPWKFIFDQPLEAAELYDLSVDPDETRSVAGLFPERVREYTSRVRRFVGVQENWERGLGVLAPIKPHVETLPSHQLTMRPATCIYKPKRFREKEGVLIPVEKGLSLIRCEIPMAVGWQGRVDGLQVLGNETIPGAWISVSVHVRKTGGARRQVAGCQLNQATQCKVSVPGGWMHVRETDDVLEVEVRHVVIARVPTNLSEHHVSSVVVSYRSVLPLQ